MVSIVVRGLCKRNSLQYVLRYFKISTLYVVYNVAIARGLMVKASSIAFAG